MAAPAETTFTVASKIYSPTFATVDIEGADDAVGDGADATAVILQRKLLNVTITYDDERKRVTVTTSPTEGAEGFVRSRCLGLPPAISTGFLVDNVGVLASMINAATEVLLFAGRHPPPPVSVRGVFRPSSKHKNLLKITISDADIFTPLEARLVAKTELTLHTSERLASGVLFAFLIQRPNLEENLPTLTLSARDGNTFVIQRSLGRKLLRIHNKDVNSLTLLVATIPKSLFWLLRFRFEESLDHKAEMVRDLMVQSSQFVVSVLSWLPHMWDEDVALCGCKILASRINFDLAFGQCLKAISSSLGLEESDQ